MRTVEAERHPRLHSLVVEERLQVLAACRRIHLSCLHQPYRYRPLTHNRIESEANHEFLERCRGIRGCSPCPRPRAAGSAAAASAADDPLSSPTGFRSQTRLPQPRQTAPRPQTCGTIRLHNLARQPVSLEMIDGDGEEDTGEEKSRIEGVDIPWSSRRAIWGIGCGEVRCRSSLRLFGWLR